MAQYPSKQNFGLLLFALLSTGITTHAQTVKPPQPVWWFGASGAANFNFYRGTTQMLNEGVTVPTAFHKGEGVKPYFSVLTEFRPNKVWGGMLNVAYDNRGGKFDGVMAPCDCPATLSSNINYVAIEPSLRVAPFSSSFYLFAGPTLSFNVRKQFNYTQEKQPDTKGEWSDIRKTALSAQAGAGIDLRLSAPANATQVTLSPFVSFLTDIGHEPRKDQSWSFYTVRAGIALKFGKVKKAAAAIAPEPVVAKEVQFSVRAPKNVPVSRKVKETFALRNSVFFDMASTEIPARYVQLNSTQAGLFKEAQLQDAQPDNLGNGRSARQMAVYHQILNIMGDRMRSNSNAAITLSGASGTSPAEGKAMAEKVKQYLVTAFGIAPSRITTEGTDKPALPSEKPGATKELALLREGDRRVDIRSTSPELLLQVGGSNSAFLKPVQITALQTDPLDSHVLFNVAGASELLQSWTVQLTDESGKVQQFGPFTQDQASVPGKTILGNKANGVYKIEMIGETIGGEPVKKQSSVRLTKAEETAQEGLRYSILFGFDESKSIAAYETFLANVVTPLIAANSTVIIHGYTDVIGEEKYNHTLSHERAMGAQRIIERALLNKNVTGVTFETFGFGENPNSAPFGNSLPEERFYNRTVIIDIIAPR